MISGIYYVIFKSPAGKAGDGLAVIENGRIHGGDNRYLYAGRYWQDGSSLKAEIRVTYYRGKFESLFGPLSNFQLTLSGTSTAEHFNVNGHVIGQSQMKISIEGQKQAELVD